MQPNVHLPGFFPLFRVAFQFDGQFLAGFRVTFNAHVNEATGSDCVAGFAGVVATGFGSGFLSPTFRELFQTNS